MKFLNRYLYIALALFVSTACEPDLSDELVVADPGNDAAGSLNLSKYVAVGNSLTAGFTGGALYEEGQLLSYPNILASQFSEIGGGDFTQPWIGDPTDNINDPGFGVGSTGFVGYFHITNVDATANPPVSFSRNTNVNTAAPFAKASGSDFNNLGIPGIRVMDVSIQGYGSSPTAGNPYFFRITPATDPLKTYVEMVAESNATFFTCWLGNNDVLGYATSGGVAGVDGSDAIYTGGITPRLIFETNYDAVITALTNNGAQGVVITIPKVTDIPFFTTVTPQAVKDALVLDATTVGALSAAYTQYNAAVSAWNAAVPDQLHRPFINFVVGNNFPVIIDESLADVPLPTGGFLPKYRMLTSEDLLLLTTPTADIALGLGTAAPIPSQYTLTVAEQANISQALLGYNNKIKAVARDNSNIALWDANAFFSEFVQNGVSDGSLVMNSTFISGGAFSLDGVHATPRGYALVANKIIETVNNNFGVTVLPVKLQDYRTVKLQEN